MSIDTHCFKYPVTPTYLMHRDFVKLDETPQGFHKFVHHDKYYFFLIQQHNCREYYVLEFITGGLRNDTSPNSKE